VASVILFEPTVVGVQETEHTCLIIYPLPAAGKFRADFYTSDDHIPFSLSDNVIG
jgi:hypothetical protein